jgi:hypothetical protein
MKSSVGVTICAVVLLIASAFGLIGAGGLVFMAAGPMSRQFFDPANLPPGADVGLMRSMMIAGALFTGLFAAFGLATGIGLIRLWKWARYAAIVVGAIVIVLSVLPGIAFLFVPLPPPPAGSTAAMPATFRLVIAAFYFFWAALGGVFVYVMARKATADQFNGGPGGPATPRVRPISVTIIGWLMIVSAAMSLPMIAAARIPASVLGLILVGGWAKLFFIFYLSLNVLVGLGLLKRSSEAIWPAIGIQAFSLVNALTMASPSVWSRLQQAIHASPIFHVQPQAAALVPARYFAVLLGVVLPVVVIFFLLRARRSLVPRSQ